MPKIKTVRGTENRKVVSQREWIAARKKLLAKEKKFSKQRDELNLQRRKLPWVKIEKEYVFDGPRGKMALGDLFGGKSQLIIYHFMFGPDWAEGCPGCSFWADNFNGIMVHLQHRDIAMLAVSRAPLEKLQAYQQRMGWTFPWASSFASDFNADFSVRFSEEEQREGAVEYNYRREPAWTRDRVLSPGAPVVQHAASSGTDAATYTRERPGVSAFVLEDGVVHHTYSAYARGLADLRVLANLIPADGYLHGPKPTSIDAGIYGFIANIYFYPIETPLRRFVVSQANLVRHCTAIHAVVGSTA